MLKYAVSNSDLTRCALNVAASGITHSKHATTLELIRAVPSAWSGLASASLATQFRTNRSIHSAILQAPDGNLYCTAAEAALGGAAADAGCLEAAK